MSGQPMQIHPVVRDEIYRIGYEAIRNACMHSGGDRLTAALEYARDLTLRISDNGTGIDAGILARGKDDHFGVRGMKERAERIEAQLTIASAPGSGTTITLIVPGRVLFRT